LQARATSVNLPAGNRLEGRRDDPDIACTRRCRESGNPGGEAAGNP
jgi:hypothetical protein